jgi:hypothetical protein
MQGLDGVEGINFMLLLRFEPRHSFPPEGSTVTTMIELRNIIMDSDFG